MSRDIYERREGSREGVKCLSGAAVQRERNAGE